ncbi:hypothetical protein [Providencia sp. SP181]|uniref:hypothetical protein n=1 Tax=Providencia sp. SP181 TaxID=3136277 RepID=UPI003D2E5CA8
MNRSWLLNIALGVAIFFAITYAIFFYWNIDNNNKWSTFFSFTSTFGIVATITIYFLQKKHSIELENKKNERIDSSISKILLMECQRISYDVEFMQKSYMFLSQKKPDNPEVKKEGIYYYIISGFGERKTHARCFYSMDTSKLMEALRLAVNNNSKHFDTIYQFIDAIEMANKNLNDCLFDIKYLYQENNLYNMSLNDINIIIHEIYH